MIERKASGELGDGDAMPPGPYSVGMTKVVATGKSEQKFSPPYTVLCGDGRAVAGHVPSREIAEAIVWALNRMIGDVRRYRR